MGGVRRTWESYRRCQLSLRGLQRVSTAISVVGEAPGTLADGGLSLLARTSSYVQPWTCLCLDEVVGVCHKANFSSGWGCTVVEHLYCAEAQAQALDTGEKLLSLSCNIS